MKTGTWAFLIGLVAVVGVVAAFATGGADEASDETADNVFLGELDLAERMEIWRNQYRRMTPGDEPLVQDVGTWPAAWEEFGRAWDAAPAERDLATWLVPVTAERSGGLTVLRDANGNALWSGAADFAKEESAGVTLTGALVDEEDWVLYEAAKAALASGLASRTPRLRDGEGGGTSNELTGLRFVSASADFTNTPPSLMVGLTWTNTGTVDVFAYGPLHVAETNEVTYTNDENVVVATNIVSWHSVEPSLSGFDNAWTWAGTLGVTNSETNVFVDTSFTGDRAKVRFYAAAPAVDTDGDGLNDGFEIFVSHSNPECEDSDGDGIGDAQEIASGINPSMSNVWWVVRTTNRIHRWVQLGTNIPTTPQYVTNYPINGFSNKPTANSVVHDVLATGFVDDILCVDSNVVGGWDKGPTNFINQSVVSLMTNAQSGILNMELWDLPDTNYVGTNEVKLGESINNQFRVVWEWWVPMDFCLEHVYTYGAPLVVNPSGSCTNRPFLCEAGVLPANIPDESICWSCTNAGMSFAGGVTNGRMVELTGTTPGDWEATATVQDSTLPPSKLRGKILEKKTVMVYLHIVRKDDGTSPAFTVAHFNDLLDGANEIHQQSGIEFVLATNVVYTNKTEWLEISTTDDWAEYHDLQSIDYNAGGIEVYCINSFEGGQQNGLSYNASNRAAGITISLVSTAGTLAHELGHACGLNDVYVNQKDGDQIVSIPDEPVTQEWLPGDWCAEAPNGGYGQLTQQPLLRRILMYGVENANAVDIPNGSVYGYDRNVQTGLIAVGITNMTREPHHW